MSKSRLAAVAVLIVLGLTVARHWEEGVAALDRALGGDRGASASGLDIRLELGFKGRGGWIEEGEDRKIYLLGSVRNPGSERVERLVLAATIEDAGGQGLATTQEIVLGPFEPGAKETYEDLVSYLLPSGEDERGNEVFEFSYELDVVRVE